MLDSPEVKDLPAPLVCRVHKDSPALREALDCQVLQTDDDSKLLDASVVSVRLKPLRDIFETIQERMANQDPQDLKDRQAQPANPARPDHVDSPVGQEAPEHKVNSKAAGTLLWRKLLSTTNVQLTADRTRTTCRLPGTTWFIRSAWNSRSSWNTRKPWAPGCTRRYWTSW